MFSRMQFITSAESAARFFGVELPLCELQPSAVVNAFDHPFHPVIICEKSDVMFCDYRWGLVPPDWNKSPESIWNHTISAKLEYLHKRYAWQKVSSNRCAIPVTGYFEYHWNDPKGKSKTRYLITDPSNGIFALGGLFSHWTINGVTLKTFAVCTTSANEVMQFVHNKDAAKNYARMPVMLNPGNFKDWLDPKVTYNDFAFPNYRPELQANPDVAQTSLF